MQNLIPLPAQQRLPPKSISLRENLCLFHPRHHVHRVHWIHTRHHLHHPPQGPHLHQIIHSSQYLLRLGLTLMPESSPRLIINRFAA
jgi:hypothetical protein